MPTVKGTVIGTHKTQSGIYSLNIKTAKGNEVRLGFYKTDPGVGNGGEISVDYTKKVVGDKTYYNATTKTLNVISKGSAPSASTGGGYKGDSSSQKNINMQTARRDAISVIQLALAHESLPLGSKKAERLDIIVGAIEEVTASLYKLVNEEPTKDKDVAPKDEDTSNDSGDDLDDLDDLEDVEEL